jgi:hypothetical protein
MVSDLRSLVLDDMRLHPRVAYQSVMGKQEELATITAQLPELPAFRTDYYGAISVLDWDHRLPSKMLSLRIFAYYSEKTLEAGQEAFDDRLEEIGAADKYPEFDVPDFDQLAADEAYEIELTMEGEIGKCRLTSAWRRDVGRKDARGAVDIARKSSDFGEVKKGARNRAAFLGDLEAVSWTPPCESMHPRWTMDVWYLLNFDGRIGTGRSFLVDYDEKTVVAVRDFSVRAG